MHVCKHADSNQLGHLHIPLIRSSKTASSTTFPILYSRSWRSDHTNCAIVFTQHALGQFWSQFLQLQTAACFYTLRPASSSLCCHLYTCSETKFVVGAVPDASTLWSTYSHRPGHSSLATPLNASANLQYLHASFHRLIQTKDNNRSHRQGETQNHTAHAAAEQQTIPRSVNYNESRWIQDLTSPCSD